MGRHIVWLVTEYKRAAFKLPAVIKRAVICAVVIITFACMIAFCTVKLLANGDEVAKISVGYVADDNVITQMAISYVENMESVKSICNLEKINSEEIGLEMLEMGKISALVVLPENVVDEINYGTNTHGTLYLSSRNDDFGMGSGIGNVAIMLFEEVSNAGMGMLSTAQAEIYATYSLFSQAENLAGNIDYDEIYNDIDRFNLLAVGNREDLFKVKSLAVTGNDTYTVYYTCALLAIYLMITGLLYGDYCKRSYMEQVVVKRRMAIGFSYQLLCRYMAGVMLTISSVILPFAILGILWIKSIMDINITIEGILVVLMATIFMTIFNILIFEWAQNRQAAVVIIGFNAIIELYMSGCIVPSVLLPNKIAQAGEILPASHIRKAFRILITGRQDDMTTTIKGLIIWSILLFVVNLITINLKQVILPYFEKQGKAKNTNFNIPILPMVVLRRFLHKKSIWMCLIIIAVASILILKTEKTSGNSIVVAYYDESGEYGELLDSYEGIVCFSKYDSEEDIRRAVLRDEVECGYVIPKNLTERMLAQMSNGLVTVYQDDDAIAVPVANEVIFEKIFKNVSIRWYENYIKGYDESMLDMAGLTVKEKLSEGITFDIDVKRIGEEKIQVNEHKATYPIAAVACLIVVICFAYGIAQVISDAINKRFYRCKKNAIYAYTIIIPILFGIITGIIIIAVFLLTS